MRSKLGMILTTGFLLLAGFWLIDPATGVTDGQMRRLLEANNYGERLIKAAVYAKSTHDVYNHPKRGYVHGLPRVTKEFIYEPDVYTWELAVSEHRRQIDALQPPPPPPPGVVQPVPMEPMAIAPTSPEQIQLTPLGDGQLVQQVPADADVRMQHMLERARASGLRPDAELKAQSIKQRLLEHMQGINQYGPVPSQGQPNLPVLSLPQGKHGDSCDTGF